jgi:hypothetical protein
MDLIGYRAGHRVTLLIFSWTGQRLPSGRSELISLPAGDYRIADVAMGSASGRTIAVALAFDEPTLPSEFALSQNYPNPFNPETNIEFSLPSTSEVNLSVYNVLGRRVRQLAGGVFPAGSHTVVWDGTDDYGRPVASGLYLYRLSAGPNTQTRKMMLLK